MLKITVNEGIEARTVLLEGMLAGPWVDELEHTWLALIGKHFEHPVVVDLAGVTFVDAEGKKVLGWIYEEGADLRGSDVMNKSIIEEIKQKHEGARKAFQWFHRRRHTAHPTDARRGM
jgi:anti-anti-sigma regulatory factor